MAELFALIEQHKDLANVVAAIASAVAAALSLVLSIASLSIALGALRHQRRHDVQSLRPLAEVIFGDYENKLKVALRNNGAGPLLVTQLVVVDGASVKPSLLDWMPELPDEYSWETFSGCVDGRSILPGGSITLVDLRGDPEDEEFARHRDDVRAALCRLTVNVEFTDIFETAQGPYKRSLEWFGRHLVAVGS